MYPYTAENVLIEVRGYAYPKIEYALEYAYIIF